MISKIECVPLYKNKTFLHQKYVVEGRSPAEIASEIFSSRQSVSKYLEHFEIPLRPDDSRRTTGAHTFGYKLRHRQAIPNKREQEAIEKMIKLRAQGFSYEKIAEILNTIGVTTKRGGAKWYAKTIRGILLRTQSHNIVHAIKAMARLE